MKLNRSVFFATAGFALAAALATPAIGGVRAPQVDNASDTGFALTIVERVFAGSDIDWSIGLGDNADLSTFLSVDDLLSTIPDVTDLDATASSTDGGSFEPTSVQTMKAPVTPLTIGTSHTSIVTLASLDLIWTDSGASGNGLVGGGPSIGISDPGGPGGGGGFGDPIEGGFNDPFDLGFGHDRSHEDMITHTVELVPLPAPWALGIAGLLAVVAMRRRMPLL